MTNEQYALFVQQVKGKVPDHWQGGKISSGKEKHPVVNVSWYDARAFCMWLSEATGQVIRLPARRNGRRRRAGTLAGSKNACIPGVTCSITRSVTRWNPGSARRRRWVSTRRPATARTARRTWRATYGNGAAACTRGIPTLPRTVREDVAYCPAPVCCVAAWLVSSPRRCAGPLGNHPGYRSRQYGFRVVAVSVRQVTL